MTFSRDQIERIVAAVGEQLTPLAFDGLWGELDGLKLAYLTLAMGDSRTHASEKSKIFNDIADVGTRLRNALQLHEEWPLYHLFDAVSSIVSKAPAEHEIAARNFLNNLERVIAVAQASAAKFAEGPVLDLGRPAKDLLVGEWLPETFKTHFMSKPGGERSSKKHGGRPGPRMRFYLQVLEEMDISIGDETIIRIGKEVRKDISRRQPRRNSD